MTVVVGESEVNSKVQWRSAQTQYSHYRNPKNTFHRKRKTQQIHMELQGASNRQVILEKKNEVRGVIVLFFIP